ncbi:MAG: hypothetical protein KF788_15480 [Piscinibacter sp.]|nr:hypothetical protein [Piscinibacter sp.]
MSISAALAIVNPIAARVIGSGPTPFASIGTLGNAQVRIAAQMNANPKLVDRGLYVIVSADGQSFYHGKGDGLTKRLGEHRGCAERLGYKPHSHAVAVWFAPSASTNVRALERDINEQLLRRNRGLPRGSGLRATNKVREFETPDTLGAAVAAPALLEDSTMHAMTCSCRRCRQAGEVEVLAFGDQREFEDASEFQSEFEFESEFEGEFEGEGEAMDDAREYELALELLSVSNEEELEQFLGKLVSGAWKGLKKVGSAVGKVVKPLGGVLRTVAKTALPLVGGALGSFIPIPGVGTLVGRAVGQAVSSALEAETAGLDPEVRDLEMARRFVRIADTAARRAVTSVARGAEPMRAVQQAVAAATHRHAPGRLTAGGPALPGRPAPAGGRMPQRWVRRGNTIVVHDV